MIGLNAVTTVITPVLAAEGPIGHTLDKPLLGEGAFALTMQSLTLLLAFVVLLWLMSVASKTIRVGDASEGNERYLTKGRFGQVIEVIVIVLRDMFIKPQLGKETDRFLPFLLTLFFFILVNNLIGLVPLLDIQHLLGYLWGDPSFAIIGGTPTGRLGVNAALALVAFLVWNGYGMVSNGVGGWLAHFTGGAPWYVWPIMIPVEIIGAIVKPVALTIRLFANMTAGHVLLAAVVGFAPMAVAGLGAVGGGAITFVSFIAGILIFYLEVFVALLQAFIFMFLSAVFIAQMAHHDHGHEEPDLDPRHDPDFSSIPQDAKLGAA